MAYSASAILSVIESIVTSCLKNLLSIMAAVKQLKVKKNSDIIVKKQPKNTDSCWSNDFNFGSTNARYPQIKNSIYESAAIEIN